MPGFVMKTRACRHILLSVIDKGMQAHSAVCDRQGHAEHILLSVIAHLRKPTHTEPRSASQCPWATRRSPTLLLPKPCSYADASNTRPLQLFLRLAMAARVGHFLHPHPCRRLPHLAFPRRLLHPASVPLLLASEARGLPELP